MADGYALDWDMKDAQANDGAKIKLAPGVYPFEVVGFERMRYEGGAKIKSCPMACITIAVTGTTEDGSRVATTTIKEYLKLWSSEFLVGLIGSFFRSIGSPTGPDGKTVVNWMQPLVGKTGFVEIDLHEFVRDGQTNTANRVKTWMPPDQGAAMAGPFEQSAAAPQPAAQPAQPYQPPQQPQPAQYQLPPQRFYQPQQVGGGF